MLPGEIGPQPNGVKGAGTGGRGQSDVVFLVVIKKGHVTEAPPLPVYGMTTETLKFETVPSLKFYVFRWTHGENGKPVQGIRQSFTR